MKRSTIMGASGFTLLELVLATLISSLVIAILSVSMGLSLRIWERQQNQKPSDMPAIIDLMKWQMANFDPVIIDFEGESKALFDGDEHSLVLATDYGVKAISRGVPVVARYVYMEKDKKLYYAEMLLDPYHPETIEDFLEMKPGNDKSWPRFYPTDAEEFSFGYRGGEEEEAFESEWKEEDSPPAVVMVKWSPADGAPTFIDLIIPNFLFPRETDETEHVEGLLRSRRR